MVPDRIWVYNQLTMSKKGRDIQYFQLRGLAHIIPIVKNSECREEVYPCVLLLFLAYSCFKLRYRGKEKIKNSLEQTDRETYRLSGQMCTSRNT